MRKADFVKNFTKVLLVGEIVNYVGRRYIVDVLSQLLHLPCWILEELSACHVLGKT